jgi:hypothetical protein
MVPLISVQETLFLRKVVELDKLKLTHLGNPRETPDII